MALERQEVGDGEPGAPSESVPAPLPTAFLRNYSPRHIAFTHRMQVAGCRWSDVFREGRLKRACGMKVLTNHYWNHDHPDDPRMWLTAAFGSLCQGPPAVASALLQMGWEPSGGVASTPAQARDALASSVERLLRQSTGCTIDAVLDAARLVR